MDCGHLAAALTRLGRWAWLALALAMPVAAAAQSQKSQVPAPSFELRAEGSFPLQYIETRTSTSNTRVTNVIPYLGLIGTAQIQPDLYASVFANGGHGRLGTFLDTDNTFASAGTSLVRRWGAFAAGFSVEHTRYFEGTFGEATNVANDTNLFANYRWTPNPSLRITPSAAFTTRLDDTLAVQRYSASARIDIEQQLSQRWWFLVSSRFRHLDYVNNESGRRDARLAVVTGLRYVINDSMSARMLTGWEHRGSNVPSRVADRFTVGASFDVEIDFARPRLPVGRW